MDVVLQVWGGGCYLLNKICLARAEGTGNGRILRMWGWAIYLVGLPAWVTILLINRDWMAATVEAGGAPAMLLGLMTTIRGGDRTPRALERLAASFAYFLLVFGIAYSLYDYGGITAITQVLELGVIAGFLLGTYFLARKKTSGWLWFMLMNTSMGLLMWTQSKPILAAQQFISLCFVINGYCRARQPLRRYMHGPPGD